MDLAQTYSITIAALGALSALMFCQLIVADVVGVRAKHLPGSSVPTDHSNLLFRTTRTVANTNESIAIFILAVLFCVLSGASPTVTAYGAWGFVISRALYAICYYANLPLLRSTTFALALLAIVALLITGFSGWF
ncbi:MAG: hypothetical protein AseanaTS_27720 [Candidatus Pelagadaptatus aseana]|uniref:MAPEG family protein n=1 Tax=Candidatus Pelagadaptatus aseana TaxID=3120508 RepID=UPI0039B1CD4D